MNHTIFSVTYIAIVAAAGLVTDTPAAWVFAAITAALAFYAGEADLLYDFRQTEFTRHLTICLALSSWATGAIAGLSLLF